MSTKKRIIKIVLEVDEADERAIHSAISYHQTHFRCDGQHMLPDHDGDTRGATLAEICRSWLDSRGAWEYPKS